MQRAGAAKARIFTDDYVRDIEDYFRSGGTSSRLRAPRLPGRDPQALGERLAADLI